jgi:ubiquinone/menaquinone biosynthesis C-methylase UbiE
MTVQLAEHDPAAKAYHDARLAHWDEIARRSDHSRSAGAYYHQRLAEIYRFLIPVGLRVLEIGCGQGDLLAALNASVGVGLDWSSEMISRAKQRHSSLQFICADAQEFDLAGQQFDVVVLSDLVNDLWDVQEVLEKVHRVCHPGTRVILNFYSHLWSKPLAAAQSIGAATPTMEQNWLTREDVESLLYLAGFETLRVWQEVLWPVRTWGMDALFNRWLVKLPVFRAFALTNFCVARLQPKRVEERLSVSVIVPARNEAGNVPAIFERIPEMGAGTEIIFVEGHSSDDTYAAIERGLAEYPQRKAKLFRQTGKGKGDAVRLGFGRASGDVLMILDADLTVPPEDLPTFLEAIESGRAEFVNGVRLVYPMEKRAMRLLNLAGNKFFGWAFSRLLGQSVKDTLCGTKVIRKSDYEKLAANRAYFGDFDPFGDFDLLFGAAKMNLKILDLPVRYRERTYGTTNISRFRHGLLLLRMTAFAARRLKFV